MAYLESLLAAKSVLLGDGGIGTGLFAMGLSTGDSPELWNVLHPDRVAELHRGFVAAGSDIILTNSFGGTRHRLKLHDAQDRVAELNRAAARIACQVAAAAGRPVVVGGSIGPTGELIVPLGALTRDEATDAFAEQARALADGGADVLWIETMSAAEELEAAVLGAMTTDLPVVATLSFDTNGRTMMGITPDAAVALFDRLPRRPVAFGANCGTGPGQLLATVLGLKDAAGGGAALVAKGNCGIPEYRDGHICYSGTPEVMAAYARLARDCGARIVGGCCGTTAAHVAAMRAALDSGQAGAAPDIPTIAAALGPVVLPSVGRPGEAQRDREERRRRRA
jgi:methionine synthase I (cobalamin-dependent)